jgi:pimeloyl-ACP methyl ester carboxylesterase
VIAPSRFGYLGTLLPEGATPRQQAEAFVSLLDQLDIDQTAVIAYSAGGPSAVQLALHHPQRVSALILVSTAIADRALPLPPRPLLERLMRSDFAFWLLTHPLRELTQRMFVPGSYELSPEEEAEVTETVEMLLPIKPRAEGLLFDMYVTNTDPHVRNTAYSLEEITVPALVVNAVDDPTANYDDARAMSARIPGARLITVPEGGHLLLGQEDWVAEEIDRFLKMPGTVSPG